ncbi:hypothetical protein AVEN_147835-1 [Araneus ventricosus]|uniref:Uncharacterized protein n=1 Tax=Araneus ventricosus TaxID=182803 RepID=A0A4Y2CUE9_ARAVE|nr:hypothetical protein AVEN_147835-1 [Araneus ventricosus]
MHLGKSLNSKQIGKLQTIQRIFLLKITRAYRTTPTNGLNVILGIRPLHISDRAMVEKFDLWVLRLEGHQHILNVDSLDFNRETRDNQTFLDLAKEDFQADFEIYTDRSRVDDNIGFSVCVFKNNDLLLDFCFKLKSFNSVFQAELVPIIFAAG